MPDRRQAVPPGRGLPDHRDPLAGFGGAPPAQSALTLRLVLACLGLVICTAGAVWAAVLSAWVAMTVLVVLALIALVDIAVIVRRKLRGEPG